MALNEFDVIYQYFQRPSIDASVSNSIIKGIGDDCAILSVEPGKQLVMSMDTIVSGRHFPEDMSPYHIGSRALCTSLSDLAAMGARPLWFTLGLTLPNASAEWLEQFSAGLFSIADRFDCTLVGGDTTRGPLTVTVQVHGDVDANHALRRDTAMVGDQLFITGSLGDGAAGLAVLQHRMTTDTESTAYLLSRFYAPEPQISAGQQIVGLAHAAIDISDGLLADAAHIASASNVDMVIDVERLPISSALSQKLSQKLSPELQTIDESTRLAWALTGGDDYQLLFTAGEPGADEIHSLIKQGMIEATHIGEVVSRVNSLPHVRCVKNGKPYNVSVDHDGYQHFTA